MKVASTVGNRQPHETVFHTDTEPKHYVTRHRIVRYLVDVKSEKYTKDACEQRGDGSEVVIAIACTIKILQIESEADTAKSGRKKSVKTSLSSKVKKPKKPKSQPVSEDEYRHGSEYTTIKMGSIDMVDGQFVENLNEVVVRSSKVAILGSLNVFYEFKKAFDDGNFTKFERLAIKIKKNPECFFNVVRRRNTVNQHDCDEMAQRISPNSTFYQNHLKESDKSTLGSNTEPI